MIIKSSRFDNFVLNLYIYCLAVYGFCLEIVESTLMDYSVVKFLVSLLIKLSMVTVFSICIYNFCRVKYTFKEIFIAIFFGIPLIVSYYFSKQANALMVWAYIFASKNVDYNRVFKYVLYSLLSAFVVIILLRFLGVASEETTIQIRNGIQKYRYGIGYVYTCISTIYFLFITVLYIYYKKQNFNLIDATIIVIINIVLFLLTNTKNNFVFVFIALGLVYFIKFNKNILFERIFCFLTVASAILGSIIISCLTLLYSTGNSLAFAINNLTTGRLSLTLDAFKTYGVKFFGNNVELRGGNSPVGGYNYVDSAYMQYLLRYGVLVFILILVFLTYYAYKAYKSNNKWLLLAIFVINYHATFDDRLLHITLNPFLILFLVYISNHYVIKNANFN